MSAFADLIPQKSAVKAGNLAKNPFSDLVPGSQPTTSAPAQPQNNGGFLNSTGNFAKGLVEAPATLAARPFQAAQDIAQSATDLPQIGQYETTADALGKQGGDLATELKQARASGQDTTAIKTKIRESNDKLISAGQNITPALNRTQFSGGPIAPAPQNASDVVKDVGRGAQTIALGLGSPLASGALFGAGASVENQGSDVLSGKGVSNLLVSTLAGMGAGKALDLIGKPLLNVAGKVVGTITPQTLQDVAGQGAKAVSDFMARHEIVSAGAKDTIAQIPKKAEAFDAGVNKIFKGGGAAMKGAIQSQYPGLTKDNLAKHYENVEVNNLMKPVTAPGKTFNKSADVFNDANRRGIDLKQVAKDNKIYASEHTVGGRFDTSGAADALANETMGGGSNILRPALRAASPGVQSVPISDIRNEMLSRLSKIPDAKLSPEQKISFAKKIASEYGEGSPTAARYKNGYNLEDLYNSKLQTSSALYKTPKGGGVQSIADTLTGQQKQIESKVFDDLLRKNAPKELGLDKYFKAQEGKFALANYLRTLDGNKAPQTLFQRGVKRASQLAGATTGATAAGPFGMFSGYQFGGIVADTFNNASNPVKIAYLKSIGKNDPEIYQIMKDYASKAEIDKLFRPKLKASTTIFKGPTQDGKPFTPTPVGHLNVINTSDHGRLFKGGE